jgi:hypothetical protein
MWCGQWAIYLEDIRDTVRVLVDITALVLTHDCMTCQGRGTHTISEARSKGVPILTISVHLPPDVPDQCSII